MHTGLPFLQHRQILFAAPSAPPTTPLWTGFIMNSTEPFWLMIPAQKIYMRHDEFHEKRLWREGGQESS